jgi:hypothetical protein
MVDAFDLIARRRPQLIISKLASPSTFVVSAVTEETEGSAGGVLDRRRDGIQT